VNSTPSHALFSRSNRVTADGDLPRFRRRGLISLAGRSGLVAIPGSVAPWRKRAAKRCYRPSGWRSSWSSGRSSVGLEGLRR